MLQLYLTTIYLVYQGKYILDPERSEESIDFIMFVFFPVTFLFEKINKIQHFWSNLQTLQYKIVFQIFYASYYI